MACKKRIRRKLRRKAPAIRHSQSQAGAQTSKGASDLMIGGVLDPAEKAADQMANRALAGRAPFTGGSPLGSGTLYQTRTGCEARENINSVKRDATAVPVVAPGTTAAPASKSAAGAVSAMGTGRQMNLAERAFFEPRFGRDFSDVRIHDGPSTARATRALDARAFAYGTDIAFAPGAKTPHTMAHELAHVLQQTDHSVVQRQSREARILKTSRDYKIPPGTSGCYLHLLLLIDAGRNVPRLTTAGDVGRYRKYKKIARGATVSDLVAVLKKKGIAKRSIWFNYPKVGRSFRKFKKLELQGNPEGFVMSRVKTGHPAYFAVSFRNIHAGFILVTSTGKILWLDQIYPGGKDVTGQLNKFLSRFLDNYVEKNKKLHAWYGATKVTELRF